LPILSKVPLFDGPNTPVPSVVVFPATLDLGNLKPAETGTARLYFYGPRAYLSQLPSLVAPPERGEWTLSEPSGRSVVELSDGGLNSGVREVDVSCTINSSATPTSVWAAMQFPSLNGEAAIVVPVHVHVVAGPVK
jgi:hypothetical protein